jgi:Glycosyl hydrolases family 43
MKKTILQTLFCVLTHSIFAQNITVSNSTPRRDNTGQIIDAHDGQLIAFEGKYYLYGTAYGNTNGFTDQNKFVAYSSTDLKKWAFEGRILSEKAPKGVYYRPKVIFNAKTKKYVAWFNWYPVLWEGRYGVAISDKPTGPFELLNDDVKIGNPKVGDFNLLVDDDQTAYICYNTIEGHRIFVEKLNADYTASTLEVSDKIDDGCEASAMFKRNDTYYMLTDVACCFCGEGTGAKVFTSKNPLKGWTYRGNMNRFSGYMNTGANDGSKRKTPQTFNINRTEYGEIFLKNPSKITHFAITFDASRLFGSCAWDAQGKMTNVSEQPEFVIDYEKTDGSWAELPFTVTATGERNSPSTQTLRLTCNAPISTNHLKIRLKRDLYNHHLPITEMEVFEKKKNKAAATEGGHLVMVRTKNIEKNANFPPIIPAQQTYIAEIPTKNGKAFIWMGDLWGSRPDGIKGHDFQYWSSPLQFDTEGGILPMKWEDEWSIKN